MTDVTRAGSHGHEDRREPVARQRDRGGGGHRHARLQHQAHQTQIGNLIDR